MIQYAMIFIADLTPPPALCPYINGSAVLKSDDKLSRKTKCQRYIARCALQRASLEKIKHLRNAQINTIILKRSTEINTIIFNLKQHMYNQLFPNHSSPSSGSSMSKFNGLP